METKLVLSVSAAVAVAMLPICYKLARKYSSQDGVKGAVNNNEKNEKVRK